VYKLTIPEPHDEFVVCTNASLEGLGGVLLQNGNTIAYESIKLKPHELNYATHDLELATVVHTLKMWRHYLLGKPFKLEMDNQSLKYLFTQPELNAKKRGWMKLLVEYDFGINYIKGKEKKVVDALSQRRHVNAMKRSQFDLFDEVKILQQEDPYYKSIREMIKKGNPSSQEFANKDGIFYFRDRLVILEKGDLRNLILQEAHHPPYVAHSGGTKMREDLKQKFY